MVRQVSPKRRPHHGSNHDGMSLITHVNKGNEARFGSEKALATRAKATFSRQDIPAVPKPIATLLIPMMIGSND